jgi:hypothetical protein
VSYIVEWYAECTRVQHLYYEDSYKALTKLKTLSKVANETGQFSNVILQMDVR